MPNQQIEKSLSDLAITTLGDTLPGLMEYLLGFELVSTGGAGENSGTRAAGLLGFDIGGEQIMMPVLFLNGQLKGNNSLYLKSSDTFVSASPEWVEYLTSRSTGNPGNPDPSGRKAQGVPHQSLRIFNQPPQISNAKYASKQAELDDIFEEFMNPARAMSDASPSFTVPNLLKDMGKTACTKLMTHLLQDFPELLTKMAEYYPGDELKVEFPDDKPSTDSKQVEFIEQKLAFPTLENIFTHPERYDTQQKEAAFRGDLVVIDKRAKEEKSETFSGDYAERFSAPTESGFYKMLNGYGGLTDVFIGYNSFLIDRPGKSVSGCTIIDPKSGTYYLTVHGEEVLVCPKKSLSDEEFDKSFKKLTKIESAVMNKVYVAISPKQQVSAPFEVRSKDKTPNYQALRVDTLYAFEDRVREQRKGNNITGYARSNNGIRGTTIRIIDADLGKVTQIGDVIAVPSDWRIMEVDKDQDYFGSVCCSSEAEQKSEDDKRNAKEKKMLNIKPGSLAVLEQAIQDNNIKELSVDKKAGYFVISFGSGPRGRCSHEMKKSAALATLIGRFGLSQEDASGLIDPLATQASTKCWVKMAEGYSGMPFPDDEGYSGANEFGIPEQFGVSQQMTIPMQYGETSNGTDPELGRYDRIQQDESEFLMRAADSNAKSVFDPAMIGTILRSSQSEKLVDKWLPSLVDALDKSIRMNLLFLWKNSDFADMFGEDSLAEFEDLNESVSKQLGLMVLHLKQKMTQGSSNHAEALHGGQ